MPHDPPINYANSSTPDASPRRSARAWAILLAVWAVGLVVWAVYVLIFVFLFFRVMV